MNNSGVKYLALLLLATVFWGMTFPIIKTALDFISPVTFLALRFTVSAIVLVPFVWRFRSKISAHTVKLGVVAGLLLFLGYFLQTVGLDYTTSANSGIITGLYVILIPLISYTYLKMRIFRMDIFASILAFSGLIVMSLSSISGIGIQTGDILTLLSAIAYAYQIAYVSKHSHEVDSFLFTFYQILVVAILSALFIPTFEPFKFSLNDFVIFTIVFTALTAGVFSIFVSNRALIYVEPTAAGVIFVGEPIFAALFSVILLNEKLSLLTLVGGIMMVSAMFIVTYARHVRATGLARALSSN